MGAEDMYILTYVLIDQSNNLDIKGLSTGTFTENAAFAEFCSVSAEKIGAH